MSKGYTTRLAIENYLLITVDETFWTQVDEFIQFVEEYIDRETGRGTFVAELDGSDQMVSEARVFNGSGNRILEIDDAIEVDTVAEGTDPATDYDDDEWITVPANKTPKTRIELLSGHFPRGRQNITVTAKWGYSETVPMDLKLAATVLVAGIIQTSNGSEGDIQSETIGRYSVTYKTGKETSDFETALATIKGYKRIRFL